MIGKVLGGRYEILEKIGGGGMALVYKARCRLLDRYVAIKILRDEFVNDEEFVKKFRRESQAAASLSHPNIVNIYDVGVEEEGEHKIHYIVMEYIKGKTLKQIIKEKGKLTIDETINYSNQIAEALEHAHKNHLVHRDIKPHNIMIAEDGRLKVTDFGIARAATTSTVTNTSNVIGSVHYFSPEQARGGYTDEKSDIYSLGIVMYEMVTGQLPFEGDSPITVALKHVQEDMVSPREIDNTIPVGLQNIILKCVQKRQSDRYSNVNELIRDLKRIKTSKTDEIFEETSVLESATRIIPAVGEEDVVKVKNNKNKKQKKQTGQKDGGGKVIILGIFLAFLLATVMFFGFFRLKGLFTSEEVEVPSLVGLNKDVAEKEVTDLGLGFRVKGTVKSNEFKAGDIVSQDVEAKTKVKKGFPIEVTVSEGMTLIKVPNLENKDINEIDSILKEAGLKEGSVTPEYSDKIPINVVISQSPAPYTEVEADSKVNVVVSKGPEVKNVTMPEVVGQKIEDAKNALIVKGLVVGQVTPQPSESIAKGIVIWQEYKRGTELETNTSVDLYVSSGPEEDSEDDGDNNEGNNENNGSNGNNGKKDKEIPITFALTIFQDRDETEIKIIRTQDGVSEVVYNKKHKVTEEQVKINLKGKVGAKFEVFFDSIYQLEQTIKE